MPTLPANSLRQRPNSDSRYRQAYTTCQLTETETKLRHQVKTGLHCLPAHRDRDQTQTAGTDRPTLPANSPRPRPNSDIRYRQVYTTCQLTETESKLRQQVQTGLHYRPTHRDRDQTQTSGTVRPTLPANSLRQSRQIKLRHQVQTGLHYLPTH